MSPGRGKNNKFRPGRLAVREEIVCNFLTVIGLRFRLTEQSWVVLLSPEKIVISDNKGQ